MSILFPVIMKWHSCINMTFIYLMIIKHIWAAPSEFVSSSIPSWQILTAHAQPLRRARDLAFCLKVPLDSLLVWASSGGSGETARMRRLAWTFAARIGDKYQIRLARPIWTDQIKTYYGFGFTQCDIKVTLCHMSHVTRKRVFGDFRPGNIQTSLLTYRS